MKRPAALILTGTALLVLVVMRALLDPATDRLPGIDSGHQYAWEVLTRATLSSGRLPFWNPYHFAGTPHLADPQTHVFYPPALLLRWLPIRAALGWEMALHLWIAGAGTLFAARVLGLSWMAAAASSIAVMLGGSVPGWIHNGHLLLLYSAAWVPWVFALAILSVRTGRIAPSGALVAVLVMQFLTGYLQASLYLGAALALYYVFSAIWPERTVTRVPHWVPLAQLGLLGVLCAAAAAFQLIPTAMLVAGAGRSAGISYEDALEGSWRLADLTTFFFPFYRVADEQPYRLMADRLAYVGWVLTAFAPFAFLDRERRRIAVFLVLLVALVCAVTLGDRLGLFRLHYALFPGLRLPGRALFLATFGLGVLGGLGIDAFMAHAAGRRWRRLALPFVVSLAAIAGATYRMLSSTSAGLSPSHGWPWLPMLLAASLLIVVIAGLSGAPRFALAIALAAVVVDVTTLTAPAVATVPADSPTDVRQAIGPPTGGRGISLCENRIGAHQFMLNHEPTLDGVPALYLGHYAQWAYLAKKGDIPPADGWYRRIGSEGETPARDDLLDMANVTRVISCAHHESGTATDHPGFVIQNNERAWPRAMWVCAADEVSRRQAIARILQGRYDSMGTLHPRHYITVRWAPGIDDARRATLEGAHRLEDGVAVEGVTWRYVLGDPSTDAVLAIMRDQNVEDTHGVDRRTGAIIPSDEIERSVPVAADDERGERQLLIGTAACVSRAEVAVAAADRPDGYVSVRVNAPAPGLLFFSEPYYFERHAYVDGTRVATRKADVAFTAVAVPAGYHHVELRYAPSSFYLGSLISGATGIGYAGLAVVRRRRKPR